MITVDGEKIPTPDNDDEADPLRVMRLELKLCQALTALNPPCELSVVLHGRIADHLRALHRYHQADRNARQPSDLTTGEIREATAIIRALRALPTLAGRRGTRTHSLGAALGGYALDLADELNQRTTQAGTHE